jgi:hypothetical protein
MIRKLFLMAVLAGCSRQEPARPAPAPAPAQAQPSVDAAAVLGQMTPAPSVEDARRTGDAFMAALVKNDRLAMFQRLRNGYMTQEEFDQLIARIDSGFGHPTGFTLLTFDEQGVKFSFGTGMRRMRKLTYDIKTSTTAFGKYTAKLDLIVDDGRVVVDGFAVVQALFTLQPGKHEP